MLIKIKKLKFINLVLAGCILSTTIAPSAQAGWGDIFKKLVPSFLTGKTSSCDIITPDQTEMTTQKESTEEIDNTIINAKLATKLFAIGSIAISGIGAIIIYLISKKTKLSDFEKNLEIAPEKEIQKIKILAQDLKLDEDEIKKIKVLYDKNTKNNYAASSFFDSENVIRLGQSNDLQKYAEKKLPKVKDFIFAHELSHIKYGHGKLKRKILPETINFCCSTAGAILIDKILEIIISSIMPKNIETKFKIATKSTLLRFALLTLKIVFLSRISSHIKKLTIEKLTDPLSLSKSRKDEFQADLSAASLGEDTIMSGILGFEIAKKMEEDQKNKDLNCLSIIIRLKEETYQLFKLIDKHLLNNDSEILTKIIEKHSTIAKIIKEISTEIINDTTEIDNTTIGNALEEALMNHYKNIDYLHNDIVKQNCNDTNKNNLIKKYEEAKKVLLNMLLNLINKIKNAQNKDAESNNDTHPNFETRIAYLKNLLSEEKKTEVKNIKDKLFYEFELNKKDLNEVEKITNIIFQDVEALDVFDQIKKSSKDNNKVTVKNLKDAKNGLYKMPILSPELQAQKYIILSNLELFLKALNLIARTNKKPLQDNDKFENNSIREAAIETINEVNVIMDDVKVMDLVDNGRINDRFAPIINTSILSKNKKLQFDMFEKEKKDVRKFARKTLEDIKVMDLLEKKDLTTNIEDRKNLLDESYAIDTRILSINKLNQLLDLQTELENKIEIESQEAKPANVTNNLSEQTMQKERLEKEKTKPINKPSETQNIPKIGNNGAWEVIEIEENK